MGEKGPSIHIFTDHKNLSYKLKPEWNPKLTTSKRLKRWSLSLQNQDVIVHDVQGEENALPDALSRWYSLEGQEQIERKHLIRQLYIKKLEKNGKMINAKC